MLMSWIERRAKEERVWMPEALVPLVGPPSLDGSEPGGTVVP